MVGFANLIILFTKKLPYICTCVWEESPSVSDSGIIPLHQSLFFLRLSFLFACSYQFLIYVLNI